MHDHTDGDNDVKGEVTYTIQICLYSNALNGCRLCVTGDLKSLVGMGGGRIRMEYSGDFQVKMEMKEEM